MSYKVPVSALWDVKLPLLNQDLLLEVVARSKERWWMFLNYLFHRLRPDMKNMAGTREKKVTATPTL